MPPAAASAALSATELTVRSGLLPVLRERAAAHPGMAVLDLGPPSNGLLQFMGGSGCRIFYNTYSDTLSQHLQNGALAGEDLEQILAAPLIIGDGDRFDAILAWDYLDYLSSNNVRAVVRTLSHHCHPGAWLYVQTYQSASMPARPLPFQLYAQDNGTVSIENHINISQRPAKRTAAKTLMSWMPGFSIHKLHLMQDVRQEHLFRYQGGAENE